MLSGQRPFPVAMVYNHRRSLYFAVGFQTVNTDVVLDWASSSIGANL